MASIDDLFKGHVPSGTKRKLDAVQDPSEHYQQSKRNGSGAAKDAASHGQAATVENDNDDEDSGMEGPEMPPEDEGEDEDGRFFGGGVSRDTARAMELLEEVDGGADAEMKPEKIDAAWVRKLALSFEKKLSANASLRAKYADEPERFMASEADLDSEIKALSVLAEHPELYSEFIRLRCTTSLMSLLAHENTDIAIDAVEIVAELIDDDVAADAPDAWMALVTELLDGELLDLLHSNLMRLDEANDEDRTGIAHVLNVLSALAAQRQSADALAQHAELNQWLVARAGSGTAPAAIAQGAAETLAILLQTSGAARAWFVAHDGIDACLQRLASYRRGDPPHDSDEDEHAANVLASVIHGLQTAGGSQAFLDLEGIELGVLLLDAPGKTTRARAIRLLDYALATPYSAIAAPSTSKSTSKSKSKSKAASTSESANDTTTATQLSTRFVESAGLKPLFAVLRRAKDATSLEHGLAITSSLLRHLPADSAPRIRLLAKLVEKEYAVLGRLVGLRQKYEGAVAAEDRAEDEDEEEDDDDERREAHQYALRLVDTVLAWACAEDEGMRTHVEGLLKQQQKTAKKGLIPVIDGLKAQLRDLDADAAADADGEDKEQVKDDAEQSQRLVQRQERARVKEIVQALLAALA